MQDMSSSLLEEQAANLTAEQSLQPQATQKHLFKTQHMGKLDKEQLALYLKNGLFPSMPFAKIQGKN